MLNQNQVIRIDLSQLSSHSNTYQQPNQVSNLLRNIRINQLVPDSSKDHSRLYHGLLKASQFKSTYEVP